MSDLDMICEYAIAFLLNGRGGAKQLAVDLAQQEPQRPALELVFVLSIAASSIEEVFASPQPAGVAADAWRIAALIGVELHMMQSQGLPYDSCAALLNYWRTVDGYFLS
ncbi:hypothetical protein GCM10010873_36750 [Cypionkella aquatica]|uniref:Uncharacterized protein n=1 Tax=Cypionkella aquatica TaxID=1756042 RepID=A0AA37X676_9RHOB|nr:hypothetical protein [Cypionkella aquatica]GLS88701.1 hypothetical protein GCM10010873_36750 [Cypionkella aquatica]